ncbi:MAG: hypothetical protein KY468_03335 [Armatimonadetes bacterium]|nr:hypothetical protein [Armatimonadota bacterium]
MSEPPKVPPAGESRGSQETGLKRVLSFQQPARASVPEARWAWYWALLTLFLASLPYLFALLVAVPHQFFIGVIQHSDDAYVYLSWMRQAMEGQATFLNRFTTEPQPGGFFNVYFLLLGNFSRFTGIPLLVTFHLARVGFGLAFLIRAYRLLRRLFADENERKAAFLLLCFSSGLGWLFPRAWMASPTDLWQAEANTFISLYLNPLFAVSLWLMVLIFESLWAARQTGRIASGLVAGIAALFLANIHSYDILTVWAVWAVFLQALLLADRSLSGRDVRAALLLILLPIPAVLHQYLFFLHNPLFRKRALVETLSPGLHWYLLGLGLLIPLGFAGAWVLRKKTEKVSPTLLFLMTWAVVGLAVAYLPLSFQRKLVMGSHIPWAFLSGVGLVYLANHFRISWKAAVAAGVLLTSLTQFRWFYLSMQYIQVNNTESNARIFLSPAEISAIRWLSRNAENQGVLSAPLPIGGVAGYLPGLAGVASYAGHWGETPEFAAKMRETLRFYSSAMTDDERRAFLRRANIRFVYSSLVEREAIRLLPSSGADTAPADLVQMSNLRLAYVAGEGNEAVMIFRVQ